MHLGLDEVPERMNWGEAYRHVLTFSKDPSSHIAAALTGLTHPVSREWLVLADLWDLMAITGQIKNPPRYERPTPVADERTSAHYGNAGSRSPEEVKALLHDIAAGTAGYALEPERELYEPPTELKKEPRVVMTDG